MPGKGETVLFGAIEAGGTKFVCGIGTGPDDLAAIQIPTTSPESTIAEALRFFRGSRIPLRACGIGSFGPVDPDPDGLFQLIYELISNSLGGLLFGFDTAVIS